jgi:hypothetical protein
MPETTSRPLTSKEVEEVVAYELGYLDAKYKMGYNPSRSHTEPSYRKGYQSFNRFVEREEVMMCSYQDKSNWGWY